MASFPIETSSQLLVFSCAISLAVLTVTAVSFRLLACRVGQRRLDRSDYCILAAGLFAAGLQALSVTCVVKTGLGYGPLEDVTRQYGAEPAKLLLMLAIPLQFCWVLSMGLVKISILFQFLTMFDLRIVSLLSWATLCLISCWAASTIIATFFLCKPFSFNWDLDAPEGECSNRFLFILVTGVVNLVTSLVVLAIPLPVLSRLQMVWYQKIITAIVFGLGVAICILSGIRVFLLADTDYEDSTEAFVLINLFSGLEPCLAIILACIPFFQPLLERSKRPSESSSYKMQATSQSSSPPVSNASNTSKHKKRPSPLVTPLAKGFFPLQNEEDTPKVSSQDKSKSDRVQQLKLRPLGPKHHTEVTCAPMSPATLSTPSILGGLSVEDGDSETQGLAGGSGDGARKKKPKRKKERVGIVVKQQWRVSKHTIRDDASTIRGGSARNRTPPDC